MVGFRVCLLVCNCEMWFWLVGENCIKYFASDMPTSLCANITDLSGSVNSRTEITASGMPGVTTELPEAVRRRMAG